MEEAAGDLVHVYDEEVPPKKKIKKEIEHGGDDQTEEKKKEDEERDQLKSSLPFKVKEIYSYESDISHGQENIPIPCANWVNKEAHLPPFKYVSRYLIDDSVTMTTDEGFMIRCNCTDGCTSVDTCSCRQLTAGDRMGVAKSSLTTPIGYTGFKLTMPLVLGLYECNEYCSCNDASTNCTNRLVQFGVQYKLLVYMTENIGWGVMCLEDIPKGSFICCYMGQICSDETADKRGLRYGDNYLAELDYIEIAEQAKEGYEYDVIEDVTSSFSSSTFSSHSSANEEREENDGENKFEEKQEVKQEREGERESLEEERKVDNNNKTTLNDSTFYLISRDTPPVLSSSPSLSGSSSCNGRHVRRSESKNTSSYDDSSSCRQYYHEKCSYVVDANTCGNVARFFNHSCSPNLFVQNVFINSHDLRFPWIAFFAKTFIPAYTQLCWDYNYEIGSVEGKEIICRCEAINCRKRLL